MERENIPDDKCPLRPGATALSFPRACENCISPLQRNTCVSEISSIATFSSEYVAVQLGVFSEFWGFICGAFQK